ncbi:MAG: 2,3-bisphosphoglycerate-independent phosphoglycerate mutase [Patescibacteria group bacterium]|nr:2,3-bisphosphoglycerate-independent phosphoglycerate mutase [Patescibacteria group bacterium]MDD5715191.1 2,3-bisphosphoglycerate-independent phosphoglycerate mutase [Patescibacteria group bacterium]
MGNNSSSEAKKRKPFILAILDGWGIWNETRGNAIALASTPIMDMLTDNYPNTLLGASGRDAGLPPTQDGNSEAGHMNIGAGRIVEQDSVIISKSINEGTFFKNPAFLAAIRHVQKHNSRLHLMGMITAEQSAHADPDHLLALLTLLRIKKIHNTTLHLFTDGRDSYQYLAIRLIDRIKRTLEPGEKIATIIGRFYAMDRIKEWQRTQKAYETLVEGTGVHAEDAVEAVLLGYNRHENDEYLQPTVITDGDGNSRRLEDNDAVIFFNLRSDRVRQLCKAFVQKDFIGFPRKKVLNDLFFVSLTDFGPDLPGVISAYPARVLPGTLPFALQGLRQLYTAETEKYAHVTYFLNGGHDSTVANEDRVIIKSPHIQSYKDKPEMSAAQLTDYIVRSIHDERYDFICVNYANPDMVGHTGDLPACITAVQTVDLCIGRLYGAIREHEGTLVITADHGNVEELVDLETGQVDTSHSSNPVPFIIVNKTIPRDIPIERGVLANIAPTIVHMMGCPLPNQMKETKILCNFRINQ